MQVAGDRSPFGTSLRGPALAAAVALAQAGCLLAAADVPMGEVVVCGDRGVPEVALTFDDGPHPATTPPLLRLLAEKQVPATFFLVGKRVRDWPELARAMKATGHELGNHTFRHAKLALSTTGTIREEIAWNQSAIEDAVGEAPSLLRPPFGYYDRRVVDVAREHGLVTVLWDVITYDYEAPGAPIIERNALAARPGSILLFHEAIRMVDEQLAALRRVIDELHARGYRFVRVSELQRPRADCE